MKVRDLLALLAGCDADASVFIASQPNYPVAHAVSGVAVRREFEPAPAPGEPQADGSPNDVFLIEGAWSGYGNSDAWEAARRK